MKRMKLFVPSGTPVQDSAGETLSPTQFGFDLLLPAILTASRSPSLNELDVIAKADCAFALWPPHANARATPVASKTLRFSNMMIPPYGSIFGFKSLSVRPSRPTIAFSGEVGTG